MPLDSPLDVERGSDGSVGVLHDGALIATARTARAFDIEVPVPPGPREARRAAARYSGLSETSCGASHRVCPHT